MKKQFFWFAVFLFLSMASHAIVVTTLNDEDNGNPNGASVSLREAINHSTAGATITFASSLNGQTITLASNSAALRISKDLTIDASALPSGITIDANASLADQRSALVIAGNNIAISITAITISGSNSSRAAIEIYVDSNSLTTLNDCTISGNSSGGIYSSGGNLTLNDCTVSGNSSQTFVAGGIHSSSNLEINNSTVSGNSGSSIGGISTSGGTLVLNNSTVSGNSATSYGATGGIFSNSTTTLNHSTVWGNSVTSPSGGSVGGILLTSGNDLTLKNSIIAGNTDISSSSDLFGSFTSIGKNFIGDLSDAIPLGSGINLTFASTNTTPTDLLDSTLADNGGLTLTHALLPGSPAINSGDNSATSSALTTDQRGAGFDRILDTVVDLGALEYSPAPNPLLGRSSPVSSGTGIQLNASVFLQFDQRILAGPGTINLRRSDNNAIIPSTVSISGLLVTITPDSDLSAGTRYYVEIASDALISDSSGSAFLGINSPTTLSFMTCFLTTYVDDLASDFTITTNQGTAGLDAGDTVSWKLGTAEEVVNLVFGDNAFNSIQEAIDATCSGGTIFLAAGTYLEGDQINITRNITLQGDLTNPSILSGNNTHRVIRTQGGTVTIDSLSIINGQAPADEFPDNSGGGIQNDGGTLIINNSTISGNATGGFGGGGIGNLNNATLFLNNSTISGNSSSGILNYISALTLNNSTVSDNSAVGGSGIGTFGGTLTLSNSIVAGNNAIDAAPDISGPFTSIGTNFIGDLTGSMPSGAGTNLTFASTNTTVTDLLDTNLTNNGGPTLTHALAPGSPVVNVGDNSAITISNDQRGTGFPRILDTTVDLGAIEYTPSSVPLFASSSPGAGNIGVFLNDSIILRFDQNMQGAAGSIILRRTDTNAIIPTSASISGLTVTITPTNPLPPGTGFSLEIPSSILSSVGTAALNTGTTFSFNSCVENVYVDDLAGDFTITSNQGAADLDAGDTVTWKPGTAGAVTNLIFGTDAFLSIQAGVDIACDTVFIAAGTYQGGARIDIARALTLQGDGADLTTLSGDNSHQVIHIPSGAFSVHLKDLSIIDGQTSGFGGGIFNNALLTIDRCQLTGNASDDSGGGIRNVGTLIINSSTLSNNSAGSFGAGGAIFNTVGSIELNSCTLSANSAGRSGGAISNLQGTLTISNSTLSGNSAERSTGGQGGAIESNQGTLTLNNSTLSGNEADHGAAIISVFDNCSLNHVTVTGNSARFFGGIDTYESTLTLTNSIIAGNSPAMSSQPSDLSGTFTSIGTNFIGNISSATPLGMGTNLTFTSTNTTITDLLNTTLADNGGPTLTHALAPGSIASNAGDNTTVPPALTTDQRGGGFNRILDTTVDLGAIEYIPASTPLFASSTPANGSGGLIPSSSISLKFDQNIQRASGLIALRRSDTDAIIPSTSAVSNRTVTITPDTDLPDSFSFYVEIVPGALVSTTSGTDFAGISPQTLVFTTCYPHTYVDNLASDFTITTNQGAIDLDTGDTVIWKPGTAEEVTNLTFGINAFTSIQEALNLTCPGGTVSLAPGSYLEGSEIIITKDIIMQGDAATPTILSGDNSHRVINIQSGGFTVMINRLSIIEGRSLTNVGGVGAGIQNNGGFLTVTNSTFSINFASDSGGAIYNDGTLTVTNSTFSNNSASSVGGGITNNDLSSATLNHTTFTSNYSGNGGGGINNSGTLIVNNSIIAGNGPSDVSGTFTSMGTNFIGDLTSSSPAGAGTQLTFASTGISINNLFNTTLSHNGGPTFTHALVAGSPAIDAGSNSTVPAGLATDQLGAVRTSNGTVDIGAVEFIAYNVWMRNFYSVGTSSTLTDPLADPDQDGRPNIMEFALDENPTTAIESSKTRLTTSEVTGQDYLTITLPVRNGATFSGATGQIATIEGVTYQIEGSSDLQNFDVIITEVTPAAASGLPALSSGWTYRTFRYPTGIDLTDNAFLRAGFAPSQ